MPFEMCCKVEMINSHITIYSTKPAICLKIGYYFRLFISAYNFSLDKEHILRQENVVFW